MRKELSGAKQQQIFIQVLNVCNMCKLKYEVLSDENENEKTNRSVLQFGVSCQLLFFLRLNALPPSPTHEHETKY